MRRQGLRGVAGLSDAGLSEEKGQVLFSATAAICDQLLPIDGITNARPPIVERLPNQGYFVFWTTATAS